MKTIKIIDLLNKIANGEEVPNRIKHCGAGYKHIYFDVYKNHDYEDTLSGDLLFADRFDANKILNDEIKIVDEEDEFVDIESFGIHYSWDYIDYKNIEELKKYVSKDFQKIFNTLDKLIKNQKKIIERLKENE